MLFGIDKCRDEAKIREVNQQVLKDLTAKAASAIAEDQPAALAPQPQLSDLPALVDAARRAGAPVEFSAPAAPGQVPAWRRSVRLPDRAGIAVQRQPARPRSPHHRVGGPRLRRGPAAGGQRARRGTLPRPETNTGRVNGLTGMHERVALLGGSLTACLAPGGGFVVSAVLPLGETP